LAAAVVAAAAAGATAAWRPWEARADRPGRAAGPAGPPAGGCPDLDRPAAAEGSEVLEGDLDGDGCPEAVVRTANVLERVGADGRTERFVLGADDDLALLGDWDCDGVATPGLFRGRTGEAFHFDGWARPGEALPAAQRVEAGSPTTAPC
ncbi:MAG TPA: hypothetical protein VFO65_04920, partial [Acidimicrobiales bacterium]|nr:hypothetical protein [Acidimicrobiales bacterium]